MFPAGKYFKGGTYGTDVNLLDSARELNNPKAQAGCLDRNAWSARMDSRSGIGSNSGQPRWIKSVKQLLGSPWHPVSSGA
jgi:hypothetical protein